ncbi:MAG: hypothetical protein R2940_02325 [Syntrophotaleaceae bacterium]
MKKNEKLKKLPNIVLDTCKPARKNFSPSELQDSARHIFSTRFPSDGSLTIEGAELARQIFEGGFAAAADSGQEIRRIARYLSMGLLKGIDPAGGDFFLGAHVILWSAILSGLQKGYDLCEVAKGVICVLLKTGRDLNANMNELIRMVASVTIEAADNLPDEEIIPLEKMLLGLVNGDFICPDDECEWERNHIPAGSYQAGSLRV